MKERATMPGSRWSAAYGSDPAKSRGRLHGEPESPTRSPFQRDRDRILHSNAFRRLKHKTQVFIHHEGDHYRTRLTHTLEVAQIARSLARRLGLEEDLCEAISLAHDLGHPPFGHAGERALDRVLSDHGGFDHNAQSLKVVTELERRYPTFDGLNLSWETLEGIVKHNGPLIGAGGKPRDREAASGLPQAIFDYDKAHDLQLDRQASLEGQVAAIADDIAYDTHDIDDGLRAGLLSVDDLADVPLSGPILGEINSQFPQLEEPRRVHELVRRLITLMIEDVVAETTARVAALPEKTLAAMRDLDSAVVGFSAGLGRSEAGLKRFLFDNLYRAEAVMAPVADAERLVGELFAAYCADPGWLPEEWRRQGDGGERGLARTVADYIAGMTDRYALSEHRRLFDATPDLG